MGIYFLVNYVTISFCKRAARSQHVKHLHDVMISEVSYEIDENNCQ